MTWTLTSRSDALQVHRAEIVVNGQHGTETVVWKGAASGRLDELSFELFPDRGVEALLALYRFKPCWTAPVVLTKLSEMPQETLFVVARLKSTFLVLCPLAQGPSCSTAMSSAFGKDRQRDARDEQSNKRTPIPPLLRRWGWCSWDAHGVGVQRKNLEAMRQHHPAWMVLDDGWQEEVHSDEWRKWLHTPQSRFGARDFDLSDLTKLLSEDGIQLLVWHTLLGYWGGVSPNRGYAATSKRPWWPSGLRHVCPNEVDVWEGDFSVLEEQDFARFYNDFYGSLASAGVAGVKCDGQFLSDLLLGPCASISLADAHQTAATQHFGEDAPVISCMAMTLCRVHTGAMGPCRVSDDHAYPGVPEDAASVARHIWHCSMNSLWLAPFVYCDWDMLKTSEWHCHIHAVARAVAGCPVYVSDPAEVFNMEILQPLLIPGSDEVVPCESAGLPIDREIFQDPTSSRSPWWLVNSTSGGMIVVAFGLCDTGSEAMRDTLYPSDLNLIEEYACLQVDLNGTGHAALLSQDGWDVQMHYMGFTVLALAKVHYLEDCRLAVFGLAGLWNPTGTVHIESEASQMSVKTRSSGRLLLWSSGSFTVCIGTELIALVPGVNMVELNEREVLITAPSEP
eukprot:symbB.v1.2.008665.t2/scaffold537.1/size221706/9